METEVKIELKYCERCGGLWLRRRDTTEVYCVTCAPEMRQVARSRRKAAGSGHWDRAVQDLGGAACA